MSNIKDNRKILGDILSATVQFENDRWFAVLNCKNVPIGQLPSSLELFKQETVA
ncbi:MAG: hypothetical protein LBC39_01825 [Methanobrevibacter sp.]|nr:hypothetical protein [Candidatus Methanovirga aequatorialis]